MVREPTAILAPGLEGFAPTHEMTEIVEAQALMESLAQGRFERWSLLRARKGTTATGRTLVLPKATPDGALSALSSSSRLSVEESVPQPPDAVCCCSRPGSVL
jgi:hypothetical protein